MSIVELRKIHDQTHPARERPEAEDRRPKKENGEDGDAVGVPS